MDQRFHRALHLPAPRRRDLVVVDHDQPLRLGRVQFLHALLHDADRLAHLFHADAIAVVTVAVLTHRNVEIHFGIAFVGLRLAQIPDRARAAHHHAGEAPRPGILELHDADIDVALLEDPVIGEQLFEIVADFEKRIAERLDVVDQFRRQILMHAANAEISSVQARTRGAFVEAHQLLALFEAPQRRRQRTDIHRLGRNVEEMRQQPADLAVQHPDQLAAPWHLNFAGASPPPGRTHAPD